MKQPYRVAARGEEERKAKRTLVFTTEEPERHVGPARRFLQVFLVSSLLGTALVMSGYGVAGAIVGTSGIAWAFARAKKKAQSGGLLLKVEDGGLDVVARDSRMRLARVALREIDDVRLETKTYERAASGAGAVGALEFHGRRSASEANLGRIVLVDARGEETPLGEDWLAHVDGIEWLGTIRTFLRSHGWVPADERHDDEDDQGA